MSTNPLTDELLKRNEQIAPNHTPIPYFSELSALNMTPPKMLIVTCLDPRNVPEKYLGLGPADAAVIRNICGHVRPALNDVLAADNLLNLSEVMIIHHTDCGSLSFTNDQVRQTIKARVSSDEKVDKMEFGAITDLKQSVKDDLAVLKGSPLVRKELAERASGYIFDIKTGKVTPVED